MAIEKRVLLARPHAFIVSEMRPFLVGAGYVPVRVETLEQLIQELERPMQGGHHFHGHLVERERRRRHGLPARPRKGAEVAHHLRGHG